MTSEVIGSQLRVNVDVNFAKARQIIDFHPHIPYLGKWQIAFGISEGELVCELTNLESPIELRNFRLELPRMEKVQRTETERKAGTKSKDDSFNDSVEVSAKPKAILGSQSSEKQEDTRETTQSASYKVPHVRVQEKGSEKAPKWQFETLALKDVLTGGVSDRLADLSILSPQGPSSLIARFTVPLFAIKVTEIEGEKLEDCSKRRQEIVKLRLRKSLHRSMLDYLSRAEITVGT